MVDEPRWVPSSMLDAGTLDYASREWLLDTGSLTERLQQKSAGAFRVQRLSQRWGVPHLSERQLLQLPLRQHALIREVVLLCHEQPWVYARSVLPVASLTGSLRQLRKLQNQSLGALIFQQPNLERSEFEVCLLPPQSDYIHVDYRQDQGAWARRSGFALAGKSLMVSEVFLQAFQP